MVTAEKAIREFIAGKPISVNIYEFDKPDILLWATWCIHQYARLVSLDDAAKKYGMEGNYVAGANIILVLRFMIMVCFMQMDVRKLLLG